MWREIGHGCRVHHLVAGAVRDPRLPLLLIALWTTVLALPISSAGEGTTPFADALFTAVSTIASPTLIPVELATHWSPFGNAVIFIGVNIGGMDASRARVDADAIVPAPLGLRADLSWRATRTRCARTAAPGERARRCGSVRSASCCARSRCRRSSSASAAVLIYLPIVNAGYKRVEALWYAPYYA